MKRACCLILCTLFLISTISSFPLAQYYCGFGSAFCGQSSGDDTNSNSSLIILAFAIPLSNGSISFDAANFPCTLVSNWHAQGKKVALSIGGENAQWSGVIQNPSIAVSSIVQILSTIQIDGIDLDIEEYTIAPQGVANFINMLKPQIRGKFLSVAPQCVGVYQGQTVPSSNSTTSEGWNFWVPIIQSAGQNINLYNIQAYNNWYDGLAAGSLSYLQDITMNWLNVKSNFCPGCTPIANFSGVPAGKIAIGVPASGQAGSGMPTTAVIQQFQAWTQSNNYAIAGMFLWDSYWDSQNNFITSNAILASTNSIPLTPSSNQPSNPICTGPLSNLKKKDSQFWKALTKSY